MRKRVVEKEQDEGRGEGEEEDSFQNTERLQEVPRKQSTAGMMLVSKHPRTIQLISFCVRKPEVRSQTE